MPILSTQNMCQVERHQYNSDTQSYIHESNTQTP